MKKELEALSKDKLITIAEHYNMFKPEEMTKKQLINKILEINHIKTKKEVEVKLKTTNGNKLYMVSFLAVIILLLVATIAKLFTTFYFNAHLFHGANFDTYWIILSFASLAWTLFVFYSWLKSGTFNVVMIVISVLSVAWFIHFMIDYHHTIAYLNGVPFTGETATSVHLYETMFYVWVGLTSTLAVIAVGAITIHKIIYR